MKNVILLIIKNHKLIYSKNFKNENSAYDYIIENFTEMKLKLKNNNYLILDKNKIKKLNQIHNENIIIIIADSEYKTHKNIKDKIEIKNYLNEEKVKCLNSDEQFDYIILNKKKLNYVNDF